MATYTVRDANGSPLGKVCTDRKEAESIKRFYVANGYRELRISVKK